MQLLLCSDLSRSQGADVFLLNGTKQSLDLVASDVSSVGFVGYSGHRAPSTRMAQCA